MINTKLFIYFFLCACVFKNTNSWQHPTEQHITELPQH